MCVTLIEFIILISLSLSSAFAQKNLVNCDKKIKDKFDESTANIYGRFGREELKFPETKTQLKEYCKISKASNEFMKNYGQYCLNSTSQALISLVVYNSGRVNNQYCSSSGKLKDQFVEWAKCGNNAKTKMSKCWDKMMPIMAKTNKVENRKIKFPIICCNFYEWIKCTQQALKDMGPETCPQNAVDGYDQYIKKASGDAFHFAFRRFEYNKEKCNELYEQLPKTKPKFLHKTPFLYIFDIFDSL